MEGLSHLSYLPLSLAFSCACELYLYLSQVNMNRYDWRDDVCVNCQACSDWLSAFGADEVHASHATDRVHATRCVNQTACGQLLSLSSRTSTQLLTFISCCVVVPVQSSMAALYLCTLRFCST